MSILTNGLIAQNDKKNWIGVNASMSSRELLRYGGELDGGLSYEGNIGFLIGIGCLRVINNRFDLESGIDYSRYSFNFSYINDMGKPITNESPKTVDLLTIPINIRVKLKKHFFCNRWITI